MDLVERGELLERLSGWQEQARSSSGRVVFVGGEAGVGKTSLVRAFVESRSNGVRVLWGGCDSLSTPRPLAPFREMDAIAPLLERLEGTRYKLLTALLDTLGLWSAMVVEDAHWADEATLDALRFIGRRAAGTRSVVLVTYRDDELGAMHPLRAVMGDLATAAGCERLRVPPLSREGVRALAGGDAPDAERLYRITGGNPFYVTEVLGAPVLSVPATVTDAVLARAARLSAAARSLVELVALAPGGLDLEIAETLLPGTDAALDEAVERGLLVVAGARASFRHELARLAIEDTVAAGRRRVLHAKLLTALEERPHADAAALAHHADSAGDAERVLRYAPAAAREASVRGAHREAARQYERAVAYAGGLPPAELADLLSLWAEERIGFDAPPDRAALLRRIIELRQRCGDVRGRGEALALLARTFWTMGRLDEAFECVAEAVEILEPLPPGTELARAYAAYSLQEMLAFHGGEAVRWGTRAIELAERVGAPAALRMALNSVGSAQLSCFADLAGIEMLERAARLAAAEGDDFEAARALGNLGSGLGEIRHYEQAATYLARAITFAEQRDLDGLAGHCRAELARVRFDQGLWSEADRLADEALRHREVSVGIPIVALCVRGRIRTRRGDPRARSDLDEAWALTREAPDLHWVWPLEAGRAESAWLAGRAPELEGLVRPTLEQARELGIRWAAAELGFWLWRAGATDVTADAGPATPFDLHRAGEWRAAAEAWGELGCPYEQAEALAEGDEAAMRESLAILTRLGAEPLADRVRGRMRRAGATRVPARPRASTRESPAQLTARQLEVLALLESGLSNAEIARRLYISEKTAGHHVSAILRKLGARSRGEAAAAARTLGIVAPEDRESARRRG